MKKWEYLSFTSSEDMVKTGDGRIPEQQYLYHRGDEGWELVSVFPEGETLTFYMKRPRK